MPEPDLTLLEGIGAATARKLQEAGVLTIEALAGRRGLFMALSNSYVR
jgi:predicted flap endonuclease-1-like 5' DNA nuclease